jgi:hypothetical protein
MPSNACLEHKERRQRCRQHVGLKTHVVGDFVYVATFLCLLLATLLVLLAKATLQDGLDVPAHTTLCRAFSRE